MVQAVSKFGNRLYLLVQFYSYIQAKDDLRADGLRKRFVMNCYDFPGIFSVFGGSLQNNLYVIKQPIHM